MFGLTLEVGKSYLVEKTNTGYRKVKKIVCLADEDTVEYEHGFNFIDDRGACYNERGKGQLGDLRFSIIREAVSEDFKSSGSDDILIVPKEELSDIAKYIPVSHPDFKLQVGHVYIDRIGKLRLIDRIINLEERDFILLGSSDLESYDTRGKIRMVGNTMGDISYQRISV